MAKEYGEPLRGIRNGTCPACGTTGAELVHIRFDGDTDIRRCAERSTQSTFEKLVVARPSEVTHPGAN
jgi:hypothetical protein